jgi:hypothetical protein
VSKSHSEQLTGTLRWPRCEDRPAVAPCSSVPTADALLTDTVDLPPSRPQDASASLAGAFGGGGKVRTTTPTTDAVRLLAPFDPLVWDRRRFEILWGWPYRFEAYTPVKKRSFGYYALPLLWRERVIGWGNLSVTNGTLNATIGFVAGRPPRDRDFKRELDAELARVRAFLGLAAA